MRRASLLGLSTDVAASCPSSDREPASTEPAVTIANRPLIRWLSQLNPTRGGFVAHSVLLTILLVTATALAVGVVILQEVSNQAERRVDRRLADGATLFRTSLDDSHADLVAAGAWLAKDPSFIGAVRSARSDDIRDKLAPALGLLSVDDVLVADTAGNVIAEVHVGDQPTGPAMTRVSVAGRDGVALGQGNLLQQEAYVPLRDPADGRTIGVLRLASYLDAKDLERFRARTGLDASLFFGATRVVTTLDQPNEPSLTSVGPDPSTLHQVVDAGQDAIAWRDLPIGRVRSFYTPLDGADGRPVGMLAVALPVRAVSVASQQAILSVLPVTLVIVVLGALVGYLLARRVRDPVLALVAAASRLRDGDFSTPIPSVAEAELVALADELEMARRSVQDRVETIALQEARQRALVAALREPILIVTTGGDIADFNQAAASLFGGSERLVGRALHDLLPFISTAGPRNAEVSTWQGVVADAAGHALDVEVRRTTLAAAWLSESSVYAIHDVSQYATQNRLREQLLYDVAHELRSPLAVLNTVLEILSNGYGELSTNEFDRLLGSANRNAAHLCNLMEDLLSAGSIQSGRFFIKTVPVALSRILDEASTTLEAAVLAHHQRLTVQMPDGDVDVLADARYARQVLCNLLTNASKYSPDGETIVVRAEKNGKMARVTVEDHGAGIPAEQKAGLFERFYRVRSNQEERGIGLGLAIAKGIVEAHGGAIGVESEIGAGTKVWFTLRLAGG